MSLGMTSNAIVREVTSELSGLDQDQVAKIASAVATIIEKNNQEIDRELGRRFANIERRNAHVVGWSQLIDNQQTYVEATARGEAS